MNRYTRRQLSASGASHGALNIHRHVRGLQSAWSCIAYFYKEHPKSATTCSLPIITNYRWKMKYLIFKIITNFALVRKKKKSNVLIYLF